MTFDTATAPSVPASEDCVFERSWQAMPNNVLRSRRALLEHLAATTHDTAILDAIGAAVAEAATNAVYHAYVGRRVGQFQLTAVLDGDEIAVTVADDGCGIGDDAQSTAGRGLSLIASLADRVEITGRSGGGTRTTMWFARSR